MPDPSTSKPAARVEVFRDRAGEYRWRLRAANSEIVATSGEGYTRKDGAVTAVKTVARLFSGHPALDIVDLTTEGA